MSSKSLLPLASTLIAASSAHAAITLSLLDDPTDIINTGGTLISAVHFQSSTSGDPDPLTINGIPHIVGSSNEPNLTSSIAFEGDFRNGASGLPQDGSDIIQVLLSGIGGAGTLTLDVSGLTSGQTYLFQAYWERNPGETIEATIEGETLGGIDALQGGGNPGGTLISREFTATDGVLNASFARDNAGGDGNTWLSGYSVQQIPEPSTALLGAIGALAFLRRRRA